MIRKKPFILNAESQWNTRFFLWLLFPFFVVIGTSIISNIVSAPHTSEDDTHQQPIEDIAFDVVKQEQNPSDFAHEPLSPNLPVSEANNPSILHSSIPSFSMKLVNEDVTDSELDELRDLGITILSGEWGIDEATVPEMLELLDRTYARGMQWVINLTEGGSWGYKEDGSDPKDQPPVWQRDYIQAYIEQIKHHPGIYGYDISNEAGGELPNGDTYPLTLNQMKEASAHVRSIAPGEPIMIRMHYWDEYDGDFTEESPFEEGIADIVMLNLYSNFTHDRTNVYLETMVENDGQVLIDKVLAVDPDVEIWIALGAFQEFPHFLKPTAEDLERDIKAALKLKNVSNIGFFGWGPERYPNKEPSFTIQEGLEGLKAVLQSNIEQYKTF